MDYIKALKIKRILTLTSFGFLFLAILCLNFYILKVTFTILVFITLAINMVIIFRYVRCPQCHGMLNARYFSAPEFCPKCGHKLDSAD